MVLFPTFVPTQQKPRDMIKDSTHYRNLFMKKVERDHGKIINEIADKIEEAAKNGNPAVLYKRIKVALPLSVATYLSEKGINIVDNKVMDNELDESIKEFYYRITFL